MIIRRRLGHARVAVAEHFYFVEADDSRCSGQLWRPHRSHQHPLLIGLKAVERLPFLAQGGILKITFFATGTTNQNRMNTLGAVFGERRCAF